LIIEATNINKSYKDIHVLREVNLSLKEAEILSIVGASGAGKSTLLNIIGTLDHPDSGSLLINGVNPIKLNKRKIAAFRNKEIGFIFQFHHLLPEFTALENVCIPAYISKTDSKAAEKRAMELLDVLGISNRSTHKPSQLSGGEQQRVAVARALINQPAVVLADEPSGNLDTKNSRNLYELMAQLRSEYGQSFLVVTHDSELSKKADRSLQMLDGQLFEMNHVDTIS